MPGMQLRRVPHPVVLGAYALAVLAGATLVFLVQPMAARLLLPRFGGSPAVWITSLLLFQAALLAGYGWTPSPPSPEKELSGWVLSARRADDLAPRMPE